MVKIRFSVIIATCDRPERLAKCLEAVAVAIKAHGEADRVIVVDNGTTDTPSKGKGVFSRMCTNSEEAEIVV